ncbi:MAG: hypothetical protein AAFQ02_00950, partial [Bacteroidota bacterium]
MLEKVRKSISSYTFQDWFFLVFSVVWIAVVLLDYLNKQVIYGPSFTYFKYYGLFGFLTIVGVFLSFYVNRIWFAKAMDRSVINGLVVWLLMIIIIWAITYAFNRYWKAPLDFSNYLHLAAKCLFTIGSALILVVAAYGSGSWVRTRLFVDERYPITMAITDLAIGFVIYTFVLMLLGAFGLLNPPLIFGTLGLMILCNYEQSWLFVKKVLFQPYRWPSDLNFWGGLLLFFMLVYLTMNFLYTQAPFPLGFDARNYYVNISKLIGESQALVPGFQPYAWGLVMATGYAAFDSPEVTMFISTLGGILALVAIYEFCTTHLRISSNLSLLVTMLFLVSPTVTNHWIIEFKIDLALLFVQLVVVNLFFWWAYSREGQVQPLPLMRDRRDVMVVIVIGVLLGYGLSIKALSIFLVFGLFLAFWHYQDDVIGMLGLAAVGIGIILLAKLDAQSGLRD